MKSEFENVKSNWETFEKLCRRLSDDNLNKLLDDLGERICLCPASTRKDEAGCYPGGLVDNSLKITAAMRNLNDTFELGVPVSSIIKTGLLHNIGKIGDLSTPMFIEQDSDWHREKLGQIYKFNEELKRASFTHLSLFILQSFNITLTKDEWIAIQVSSGPQLEENKFYAGHESSLAVLLQSAKRFVIHKDSE